MLDNFTITITPQTEYIRYATSNYILCNIAFDITYNSVTHHFQSESCNTIINSLLEQAEIFLDGKTTKNTTLQFFIPYILGDVCAYPYSFDINTESNFWTFRFKAHQNVDAFDFTCPLSHKDIAILYEHLKEQYTRFNWNSIGKTLLYTFNFPAKDFQWCYSAKEFQDSLNSLLVGQCIEKIYVHADDYAEPLAVKDNFVNYYLSSELIIQTDDWFIDLLIHATGLFQWRVFSACELVLAKPILKFIEHPDTEYCAVDSAYSMFKLEYCNTKIENIDVQAIDYWEWDAIGFDESLVNEPVELPEKLYLHFANRVTMTLAGWSDDFAIILSKSN